jgi:hypothetical protein
LSGSVIWKVVSNKAYSQKEWAFCFFVPYTLRLTLYDLRQLIYVLWFSFRIFP